MQRYVRLEQCFYDRSVLFIVELHVAFLRIRNRRLENESAPLREDLPRFHAHRLRGLQWPIHAALQILGDEQQSAIRHGQKSLVFPVIARFRHLKQVLDDFVPRQSHDHYIESRGDGYDCSPTADRRTPSPAPSASSRALWRAAWEISTVERRLFCRLAGSEARAGAERWSIAKEGSMGSEREEWRWGRRKEDLRE